MFRDPERMFRGVSASVIPNLTIKDAHPSFDTLCVPAALIVIVVVPQLRFSRAPRLRRPRCPTAQLRLHASATEKPWASRHAVTAGARVHSAAPPRSRQNFVVPSAAILLCVVPIMMNTPLPDQ